MGPAQRGEAEQAGRAERALRERLGRLERLQVRDAARLLTLALPFEARDSAPPHHHPHPSIRGGTRLLLLTPTLPFAAGLGRRPED